MIKDGLGHRSSTALASGTMRSISAQTCLRITLLRSCLNYFPLALNREGSTNSATEKPRVHIRPKNTSCLHRNPLGGKKVLPAKKHWNSYWHRLTKLEMKTWTKWNVQFIGYSICFFCGHMQPASSTFSHRKPHQEKDLGENPKTHLHLTQNSFRLYALYAPTFAVPKYSVERPSRTNVPFNTNLMWKYKMSMHRKPSLEENLK